MTRPSDARGLIPVLATPFAAGGALDLDSLRRLVDFQVAAGVDGVAVFGFASEVERAWFRTLQNVQGVGAKVALALLGTLSPQDLANAIALGDWASVEQAPGIGKKLAQRIVAELKDKAPALTAAGLQLPGAAAGGAPPQGNAAAEAMSALSNLGYQPAQASAAIAVAIKELGDGADTAKLIRRGLKELAR